MVKRKILIVDDSAINRALLTDILDDEFDILEAEDGMEALAILQTQRHSLSLMLLDIVMPKTDGFEVLTAMNKNGWIKGLPVVMISSETAEDYVDKAYDLGVLDYISRPFNERMVKRRVNSTIMLTAKQKELSNMVARQLYEKEKDNRLMIEILSHIVEFRNGESGLHILHVRTFTELILKRLLEKTDQYNITPKEVSMICTASALHDIGKIAIPEAVLNKPGKLTPEEFEIMKTHSAEGARLLQSIPLHETEPLIQFGYQICRWHHERYDGRGYPDGLKGEEIPVAAQVVAMADVYDALTSKRVYKPPFSHKQAMQMILNGECGVFNPILLECLTEVSSILQTELDSSMYVEHAEVGILDSVGQILENNDLDSSASMLRDLENEKLKNRFFAELSKTVIFEYNVMPEILTVSEWGAEYLGLPQTIIDPRRSVMAEQVFNDDDFEILLARIKGTTPDQPVAEGIYQLNVKGQQRWKKIITRSLWSEKTPPEYESAFGMIMDIHDDLEKLRNMEIKATRDPLTGLFNRDAVESRVSALLASPDEEKNYALILFDLDNFKYANDEYGHLFGDEVLKYVADIIRNHTRSADIASRIGGDEYVIFMEYTGSIEPLVKRIFGQLSGAVYKGFSIQLSMGIACVEPGETDYAELFRRADEAMYVVKNEKKNSWCFYEKGMKMPAERNRNSTR